MAKASGSSTKPNSALAQSTTSSPSRLRWIMARAAAEANSTAKSRSLTASMLFPAIPAKPSLRATIRRSMGWAVPASAPAPKGSTFTRPRTSSSRSASRWSIWL